MEFHIINKIFTAVLVLYFLLHAEAANPSNDTQKLALLNLKSHFTQYPVDAFSSWNDTLHFCRWSGVQCSNRHLDVIGLDLRGMNLYGSVSPFIGNLSFLQYLDLSQNSLTGAIPLELGRLTRLQSLNLSFNRLSDSIPANLSSCVNLINISLNNNLLIQNIPSELGSLSLLERLHFSNNNLTGNIPASLGNLSSLQDIRFSFNDISGEVPETIGNLKKLTHLDLAVNRFYGIFPPAIYNLSTLTLLTLSINNFHGYLRRDIGLLFPHIQYLWLSENSFTGEIPLSLLNASTLLEIDLSINQFTGGVPSNLGDLQNLQYILLHSNSLGDQADNDMLFLNSLANCTNLEFLGMSRNNLGGTLPSSIGNLSSSLEWLTLFSNSIHGSIPKEIAGLTGLNVLYLGDNLFTSNIPASLGTLPNLQELDLYENSFTGEIPFSLGNLSQLQELYLYNTSIQGNLPSSFANLTLLQVGRLNNNKLNGTIPPHFIGLTSLIFLNLSHNSFSGPLPNEVGNLELLTVLDISHNSMAGDIPTNLGRCISLNTLYIQNNSFQGNIPDLSLLRGLQLLDLSLNNLTGQIPEYLANFSSLMNLNLSFNAFEGEVPRDGVFLNASAIQVHGNHNLCGGITQLNLETCSERTQRRVNRTIIPIVVVPSCVLLFLLVFFLYRKKLSKGKIGSNSSFGRVYPMITFKDIYDSTEGFSANKMIGSGSFGTVYVAAFGQSDLPIAVKVLDLQQRGASKSFLAECEALRNIRHRNLVRILSVCSGFDYQDNEFKALIYPYMPNQSLEKWLHDDEAEINYERKLSLTQRLNIAMDIASALEYLHHQCEIPVVHCDLKPSNVLLSSDLTAHVGDFGLASVLSNLDSHGDPNEFSSMGIKGTIGYTAPEYGLGSPVSTQGDVYSFGILLLELFTEKRPIDETFNENINLHSSVKLELPDVVLEIIDQSVPFEEKLKRACGNESKKELIIGCIAAVLTTGIACSCENPQERISMKQAIHRLALIKEKFVRAIHDNSEHRV